MPSHDRDPILEEEEDDTTGGTSLTPSATKEDQYPFEEGGDQEDEITVSEFLDHAGYKGTNLLITAGSGVAVFQYGSLISYVNLLCSYLMCEGDLTQAQVIAIKVLTIFGVIIGLPLSGMISDKIGRTKVAVFGAWFTLITWIIASFSTTLLVVTLFAVGVGFSALLTPAIVNAIEFTSLYQHSRVALVLFSEYLLGQIWTVCVFLFLIQFLHWTFVAWVLALPLIFTVVWFHHLPESPMFMAISGREERAYHLLLSLHQANSVPMKRGKLRHTEITSRGECCSPCSIENLRATLLLAPLFFLLAYAYYGSSYGLLMSIDKTGYCNTNISMTECWSGTETILPFIFSIIPDFIGLLVGLFLAEAITRRVSIISLSVTGGIVALLAAVVCLGGTMVMVELSVIRGAAYGAIVVTYLYALEWYPVNNRNLSFNFLFIFGLVAMYIAGSTTYGLRDWTVAILVLIVILFALSVLLAVCLEKSRDVDKESGEQQPLSS